MSLTDTAEYWIDVKRPSTKRVFIHIKGVDCGHYHVAESNELHDIDCFTCKKIIKSDLELKNNLEQNNGKRRKKWENKRKNKKGYKLNSSIKFGKYKGQNKSIEWIINNDSYYFDWLKDKILLHSEVDKYLECKSIININ